MNVSTIAEKSTENLVESQILEVNHNFFNKNMSLVLILE